MTESYKLQVGQLVRSIAGRDHGRYYLVYQINGREVALVDGRKRLPESVKIKNPCHLQAVKLVSVEFQDKAAQKKLTPEDIRAALTALLRMNPDEEAMTNV